MFYVIINGSVTVMIRNQQRRSSRRHSFVNGNETPSSNVSSPLSSSRNESELDSSEIDNGRRFCQLFRGDSFGEYVVNKALKREGNVRWECAEDTELLELDIDKYLQYLCRVHEGEIENRVQFMKNLAVPIFCDTSDSVLYEMCKSLRRKTYKQQKVIIKQGDIGSHMYFIHSGEVTVLKRLETFETVRGARTRVPKFLEVGHLKQREYFGEVSLLSGAPRATSVYCSTNVELFVMSKISFIGFMSNIVLARMQEYAAGYPTESEIRKVFNKQKRWERYKRKVLEDVLHT